MNARIIRDRALAEIENRRSYLSRQLVATADDDDSKDISSRIEVLHEMTDLLNDIDVGADDDR